MDDTGIPLGPQWGNSRTHQGGPSPRQPDVVEAREKFSLSPPGPRSRGKNVFLRVDRDCSQLVNVLQVYVMSISMCLERSKLLLTFSSPGAKLLWFMEL